MTIIYTPSCVAILALLAAALSSDNAAAFTPMQQPMFATRAISPRFSALSMVGSEADIIAGEGVEAASASVAQELTKKEETVVEGTPEPVLKIEGDENVVAEEPSSKQEPVSADTSIPRSSAIIPINEATLEFTSGMVGGAVGLAIAGPVGSVLGSTLFNFFSRQMDGDITEAINNTAKKSIELYNYLYKLDAKYSILEGSRKSLNASIDKIKTSGNVSPEAMETVNKLEAQLEQIGTKIDEVNNEYDITTNILLAFDKFGDIVERTVKKSIEFEKTNDLTGKLLNAWIQAIEKALEAAENTKKR
uniref:Uncharacterized protein n=1 Tax=Eucampia antarctica TaxID=49252 RepID=A0A7S2WGG8_9STRA|mmetsp:Transcript_29646/g.28492  ORF Transcript_29646/g.28492 Transcript_29646/m.28492 type:complete len:305 (+) Transcript_29646:141-1055(+)|eukprot:CAMPEP_0197833072 /NCGR_PEP_ID=MMETSP1437-20131217/17595_1 /TAXON_ID=49252 ORGANISM="Eucampia antarctica, Strain CCMP1452" /NCGR_SAMPLE_ID=MMETSP1437 /ASSEMBLY_ACC=CAM_ASM_001096 /LENGTH=304 /DNA_ID=CAMNT_0043436871 /DNA_START=132 /DNA_END=1046 /DNA_ORIENTATION=+